jgi:cytochrome b561
MSPSVLRYHPLLRLIHWLMAILVVAMIGTGFMLEEKPVVAGYPIIFWHQYFCISLATPHGSLVISPTNGNCKP